MENASYASLKLPIPEFHTMNLDDIIIKALEEDLGEGDHTSLATIPAEAMGKAHLIIRQPGIIAGIPVAKKVFEKVDPALVMDTLMEEGSAVQKGDIVFTVTGNIRSILASERLVLNFLQRMSGIATATKAMADETRGYKAILLDTRKTTPLLRELEKYAVRAGGGMNHRMGLYDMIMIKDNHVDFAGGIVQAIDAVQEYFSRTGKKLKVEIEVRDFDELLQVLEHGGVERIMLDNFSTGDLAEAVQRIDGRFETEASGGITLANLREYAATGVDFISVGALTHHIKALDMSLKATRL
jgi:nicotinate-nucleotide pyrophosphorylase (carboxylating)